MYICMYICLYIVHIPIHWVWGLPAGCGNKLLNKEQTFEQKGQTFDLRYCVQLDTYTHMHTCIYAHVYTHIRTCIHAYMHICTFIYAHVYMHIRTCIHANARTHVHMHTHRVIFSSFSVEAGHVLWPVPMWADFFFYFFLFLQCCCAHGFRCRALGCRIWEVPFPFPGTWIWTGSLFHLQMRSVTHRV